MTFINVTKVCVKCLILSLETSDSLAVESDSNVLSNTNGKHYLILYALNIIIIHSLRVIQCS